MAIASVTLFFNNPLLFSNKPLKIRRGQSAYLILNACKNIQTLKAQYQEYVYALHKLNHQSVGKNPHDKSFVKVAIAVGGIQRWLNVHAMKAVDGDVESKTRYALGLSREMKRGWGDLFLTASIFVIVGVYLGYI